MRSDRDARLRGLYRAPAMAGQAEHQAAHEDELLAAVSRRLPGAGVSIGAERRGLPWLRWPRFALAGVLGVAVAVGACVMPAEYPVSLGYGFDLSLPAARWAELDPEALAHHLEAREGVERVEIRMFQSHAERIVDGGPAPAPAPTTVHERMHVQVLVLGEALDAEALREELQASFPALAGLQLRDVPLEGTVHGTLGGKLSHEFLDVVIDRHGVEEAERRVLAELVAEGVAPEDVEVDITERHGEDGERRIEVRVKAEHAEPLP